MTDVITTANIVNKDKDFFTEICECDMQILARDIERYEYNPRWEAGCGVPC